MSLTSEALGKRPGWSLLVIASIFIVIAGLKSASAIIAPLLMAAFLSIICAPMVFGLTRRGIPKSISLTIVLGVVACFGVLVIGMFTNSIDTFTQSLPSYRDRMGTLFSSIVSQLASYGITVPFDNVLSEINARSLVRPLNYVLNGLSGLIGNSLMIFIAVLFILAEVASLPEKLRKVLKDPDNSMDRLHGFTQKVIHYLVLKALTSLITAGCVAVLLWFLDIEYIGLWSILAFFLNFIPYVGSLIAALPPILLGVLDHGVVTGGWVIAGFVAINLIVGNIIETRIFGDGLNLSSFVVFVSLIFWGWVFGSIGMFLSIPLTMLIMIALESSPDSEHLANLMHN